MTSALFLPVNFDLIACAVPHARVEVGTPTEARDVAADAAPVASEPKRGAEAAAGNAGCDSALAELRLLPDAGVLAEGAAAALDAMAPGNVKAGRETVFAALFDAADAPLPKLLPALIQDAIMSRSLQK